MARLNKDKDWYLAQVKPNCAQIAQRNLERQGFECFVPLERFTLRQSGRFQSQTRLYFPGYLFVAIVEASAPWRTITSTHGIAQMVRFGGRPAAVPYQIVSELQAACDHEGCVTERAPLAAGDDVRIAQGPFAGFAGRVDRAAPERRLWVLLDVMGKATRVSLQSRDLRLAS